VTSREVPRRVLVVASYPALRAGLTTLLAGDPSLDPVAVDQADVATMAAEIPAAIVADYSAGEPDDLVALTETFPATPLVLVGADPSEEGPGLAGAPVAYVASDIDAAALSAAMRAVAAGLIVLDPTLAGAAGVHVHTRLSP